jgi:2-oxoglutarate ferredoxin oxidoreductase subunit gamma
MRTKIILAGFGGQGVIVGGKLLAYAAMKEGKQVTHYPSYGAEMRGGTCNCSVIISDEPISSPIISESDVAVVLNAPSKKKFEKGVRRDGMILMNSSLINDDPARSDLKSFNVNASEIAEKSGSVKATNMAILGALSKVTSIVKLESLIESMKEVFPNINEKLLTVNVNALKSGYDEVK